MTSDDDKESNQPVFHGAPARPEPPAGEDNKLNKALAAGLLFGIGSAAIAAALLYTRRAKPKTPPKIVPEPSD
jgi:hypothetical protein